MPDISMDSDPFTPFRLYNTQLCHGYCLCGGTSLGAPLMAGVLTLVNQARMVLASNEPHPIGLITTYLYGQIHTLKNAQALHINTMPHFFVKGTTAVPGSPLAFKTNTYSFNTNTSLTTPENQFWNDVTGVGSPNVPNFVRIFSTI